MLKSKNAERSAYTRKLKRAGKWFGCSIAAVLLMMVMTGIGLSQEIAKMPVVSSLYNWWATAYDVKVVGDYAYIAAGETGLFIMDIRDPQIPVQVGFCSPQGTAQKLAVKDGYAYMGCFNGGSYSTLYIIDITDPSTPTEVGQYLVIGYFKGIAISGSTVYIAGTLIGLQTLDVSDPTKPVLISTYRERENVFGVDVRGDYAYISAGGLEIIDISDPAKPVLVGKNVNYPSEVTLYGDYALLACVANGFRIIDVRDPAKPVEVGVHEGVYAYNVVAENGYAYLSGSSKGL